MKAFSLLLLLVLVFQPRLVLAAEEAAAGAKAATTEQKKAEAAVDANTANDDLGADEDWDLEDEDLALDEGDQAEQVAGDVATETGAKDAAAAKDAAESKY